MSAMEQAVGRKESFKWFDMKTGVTCCTTINGCMVCYPSDQLVFFTALPEVTRDAPV